MAEKKYTYNSPISESFSVHLDSGTVTAHNHVMHLTQAQHDEVQKLISQGRHDIAVNMKHLDQSAAEKIAKDFLANKKPEAAKGPTNTATQAGQSAGNQAPKPVDVKVPEGTPASLAARLKGNAQNIKATEPVVLSNDDLANAGDGSN